MEKKLITAIALSILVIVTFQYFFVKPQAQSPLPPAQGVVKQSAPGAVVKEAEIKSTAAPSVPLDEREFEIETDKYILVFSDIGGSLKTVRLKEYKSGYSKEPLTLVDLMDPRKYIFAVNDPTNSVTLDTARYEFKKEDGVISYSLQAGNLEVVKRIILHNSKYLIELQLSIKNISGGQKEVSYRIIGGSGLTEHNPRDARFLEVTAKVDGKTVNFKRPKKGRIINPGIVSWTCLKNKYFSMVIKPFGQTQSQFYSESEDGALLTGIEMKSFTMPAGAFVENKFALYAGPNDISLMKAFGCEFEESVNYGFFGGISKALLWVLRFFYTLVRNWGIAIILLSVFLNLILSPLTFKSFKSMQKMQALHPQMEKLKAQCKDNPQKLNKEMLELYKKYNINPFSGCLPMLLQMPIFIALYNALIKSIELRGVNFLWIKDLSMPDAVNIPVTLPILGNSINILPLLMVAAMVIQQQISTKSMGGAITEEQKQQQQLMLIIMPIMFGFIFYNMPSGLVLYWSINTILTIVEQSVMFKKHVTT